MDQRLIRLFVAHCNEQPLSVEALRAHASDRQIFRLRGSAKSVIGVVNANQAENQAFVAFSRHFLAAGLPVAEILGVDESDQVYLESDLGDCTLYESLQKARGGNQGFPDSTKALYLLVVAQLPRFQVLAGKDLDYSVCYQSLEYDERAMISDMQFFRECYIRKRLKPENDQALDKDFLHFAQFLAKAPRSQNGKPYFLYRDFQSRNVMIRDERPYFIDYQSGRKGALQYDIASLLYQSKADIPEAARAELLGAYLAALHEYQDFNDEQFLTYYYPFVLMRLFQVLGTYGSQGLSAGKGYFTESIPFALRNISLLLDRGALPKGLSRLQAVLEELIRQ